MELLDVSLVNWSRAQFTLTAMYHWIFVPLTLGLGVIQAIMETIYYRTGDEKWKKATKFWMTLFGVNFAIGVATGIILEFEFGTNWSNYSWFVGDIFGAPLAIEGILAFFMEATFISIMFFGWNKVSKGFHLTSTWLTILGATLSAFWILVANAWMQHPVGMEFNPDTVRNEMVSFWQVLSPFAWNKFLHTVISSWIVGALFTLGVSAWFLIKKRDTDFAMKSIKVAAVFGLVASILTALTGDGSATNVAKHQPMKLAAMEGLYKGQKGAELVAIGVLRSDVQLNDTSDAFLFKIGIPKALSLLAFNDLNAYVPGINDIVNGGYVAHKTSQTALSFDEKKLRGNLALKSLADYRKAVAEKNDSAATASRATLMANYDYFGYGYLDKPEETVPRVPLIFYSFHLMVILGTFFIALFGIFTFLSFKSRFNFENGRWLLYIALWSIPLGFIASQLGWIVAEVGRQPWAIQDVLPVKASVSAISAMSVKITFFLFLTLFSALLLAEVRIMLKQIKKGPSQEH
ncbi:MAG: cytochrome ubiquinol oxidase subunit I [Porphyromonadaceae bacterium CG2_30_38_12]|nr:MAG: cytochrome ubiquinol oxidase subunit I [Porphyromonadaceae bacterium CG2_30_38_12]